MQLCDVIKWRLSYIVGYDYIVKLFQNEMEVIGVKVLVLMGLFVMIVFLGFFFLKIVNYV